MRCTDYISGAHNENDIGFYSSSISLRLHSMQRYLNAVSIIVYFDFNAFSQTHEKKNEHTNDEDRRKNLHYTAKV